MTDEAKAAPRWEEQAEEYAPGLERYWLVSRRYGVARTEDLEGWCVVDEAGEPTHGDLIPTLEEARAIAESCEDSDPTGQPG